jgi:hypothetical protein
VCLGACQNWGVDGFWGPPYALLQGSLEDMPTKPPYEGKFPAKYIPATTLPKDLFVKLFQAL